MALVLSGDGKIGTRVKPDGINLSDNYSAATNTDVHFEYAHGESYSGSFWTTSGSGSAAWTMFRGQNTGGMLQYRDSSNAIPGTKAWDASNNILTNYNPGNYFNYQQGWFTVPVTGYYLVTMGAMYASSSASYLAMYCFVNGASVSLMNRWEYEASSSAMGCDAAIVNKLNKYDTVHWSYHNSYLAPYGFRCGITLLGEA